MKAVIYARFSSHNQREESIDGQVRVCNDFAKRNDMEIIEVYADRAISGRTDARPEFQRMIKDSAKGHFSAVLCYAVDRFARNRYDAATYKAKLKNSGVKVYYATSPLNDNPESILLESVMEGLAEYYSENLSRSIKRGQTESAMECKAITGAPPLGYKIGPDKKYVIDPVAADVVKTIYTMYAAGNSALSICRYLNEQGTRTSAGNAWNKDSLRTILRNRKYIGEYQFRDITIEHGIPQIIPDDLFEAVQAKADVVRKARAHHKVKSEEYLLTTKCVCGLCSQNMVGESGTGKAGTTYFYYTCMGRKKGHTCKKKPEKKNKLESLVVDTIVENVLKPDVIDQIAARASALMKEEADNDTLLTSLKKEYADTERSIRNLLKAMEIGILDPDTRARMEELQTRKTELTLRIGKEEIKKPVLSKEQIVFWLTSFCNGNVTSEEYRRRIIDTLLNKVIVTDTDDGGRVITMYFNLTEHNTFTVECSEWADNPPR